MALSSVLGLGVTSLRAEVALDIIIMNDDDMDTVQIVSLSTTLWGVYSNSMPPSIIAMLTFTHSFTLLCIILIGLLCYVSHNKFIFIGCIHPSVADSHVPPPAYICCVKHSFKVIKCMWGGVVMVAVCVWGVVDVVVRMHVCACVCVGGGGAGGIVEL